MSSFTKRFRNVIIVVIIGVMGTCICLCLSVAFGPRASSPEAIALKVKNTDLPTAAAKPTKLPPTKTPTAAIPSTKAPTLTPTPSNEMGTVTRVIDGDTIDVTINGQEFRIRYIGVNTPERGEPCFSEASDANIKLVIGQTVRLVKDVSETDKFKRLLRYVYVGDLFVNAELVRRGYAEAVEYPPDTSQADYFEGLEAQARVANLTCYATGIFGGGVVIANTPTLQAALPTQESTSTQAPLSTQEPQPTQPPQPESTQPPAQSCDPAYPGVCIPPYPPDLDCGDISYRRFQVLPPDPHGFDRDNDGVGCESG